MANGVRILTEAMPQVVSSSIGIWVENGSRYEEPAENGVSHFIEHLLFKGTKKRTAAQIAEAFDAVGGVLNAFTGKEYTCYYAKVLGKDLEMATEVLADIFLESVFDPAEIERERQVVLQEISQAEDTPDDFIHDLFTENFWKGHPLALPIFGSVETVNKIDRELLISFMADALSRRAASLSPRRARSSTSVSTAKCAGLFGGIAGDGKVEKFSPPVDHPLVLNRAEEARAGAYLHRRPRYQPVASAALRSATCSTPRSAAGCPRGCSRKCAKSAAASTASTRSSRRSSIPATSASTPAPIPNGSMKCSKSRVAELRKVERDGLEPAELARAKSQLQGNMLLGMESTDSRMNRLARNEI